jgi:hypothetical protein
MRERWSRLRHLMVKDWRYIRLWAVLCWVLTATAWLTLDAGSEVRWLTGAHYLLAWILPFVAVARLLQLDPALGSTSFWATRPVDRAELLASKLAVGLLGVSGPCLLLAVAPLGLRGLATGPRDYALAFGSLLLRDLTIVWFVLIVATLSKRLSEAVLLGAALGLLLFGAVQVYLWAWPAPDRPHGASFWFVALPPLLGLQALVYLHVLYRTRRASQAALALAVSGLAIVGVDRVWRWDLIMPLRAGPAPATAIAHGTDWPIRVQVDGQGVSWRGGPTGSQVATITVRVEGVPAGVVLAQTGYDVERLSESGWVEKRVGIPSERVDSIGAYWTPLPEQAALCPPRPDVGAYLQVAVHEVPGTAGRTRTDLPRIERLRGRLRFEVVRPFVTQRARVQGGRLISRGRRIEAVALEDPSAPDLVLRIEKLSYVPFPSPGQRPLEGRPYLFDPASGDCLSFASRMQRGLGAGPLLPVELLEDSYRGWRFMGTPEVTRPRPLPATAEMVLLDHEVLGTVEAPFEWPPLPGGTANDPPSAGPGIR